MKHITDALREQITAQNREAALSAAEILEECWESCRRNPRGGSFFQQIEWGARQ
jgi:hypothetical protein